MNTNTNNNQDDSIILSIALFIGVTGAFNLLQRRVKKNIPGPQDDSPSGLPSCMKEKLSKHKPLVIYVPGLYSSTLKNRDACVRKTAFNPPLSLLKSFVLDGGDERGGHKNLSLPILWSKKVTDKGEEYFQEKDSIEADGCWEFAQPKLIKFLKTLNINGLIDFHMIPWDWRRAFEEASDMITMKIKEISDNDPLKRKIILTSHSTGAMLTWPCVDKHPELFSNWINMAGALYTGSNVFLGDFLYGWDTPGMSFMKFLSKDVFFSFPGLYTYFPLKEEERAGEGDGMFVDEHGHFHNVDYFDICTWQKYNLGIFGWKDVVTPEEKQHLMHSLAAAKRFREKYMFCNGKKYEPSALSRDIEDYQHIDIICYGSKSFPTHSNFEMKGNTCDVRKSKSTLAGDGTLIFECWSKVPGGLKVKIEYAEKGSNHVALVDDMKVHNLMLDVFFRLDSSKRKSASELLGM